MANIRQPAVAGLFYPSDKTQLHHDIHHYLQNVAPTENDLSSPKALIVPHAGYIYSGPVAAAAYARLMPRRKEIHRVILLGPSHRVPFMGIATSSAEIFATPLGRIKIDRAAVNSLADLPQVSCRDEAHALEHSLEVHLPFLMEVLDDFQVVPLVVGDASAADVEEVLQRLWGGPETLIIISSDLSHYHDYASACYRDAETSKAIVSLQGSVLHGEDACGYIPISGLLKLAKARGLQATIIDVRNSGDTAGGKDRVVGYGAYMFQ